MPNREYTCQDIFSRENVRASLATYSPEIEARISRQVLLTLSPVAAELEDVVRGWIRELLGLPADCDGGLVTCATAANFTVPTAARSALLARAGWNVEDDGLAGAPAVEVVVGEEVHASVQKALSRGGFGRRRMTVVEADEQGRMRAEKLPELSAMSIVGIQTGNVNTETFDPATEICDRAREAVINQVLASERFLRGSEGGTVWQGKTAMRISVSSWTTTEEEIERSADAVIGLARQ